MQAFKDTRSWQIGTAREVSWIANGTTGDLSITAAIPPVFEAYATCYEPDGVPIEAHERAQFTPDQPWWLVSALWDDTWTCVGGSRILIEALHHDPLVQAHRVQLGVDAKPPGRDRDDGTATETNSRMPPWYRNT